MGHSGGCVSKLEFVSQNETGTKVPSRTRGPLDSADSAIQVVHSTPRPAPFDGCCGPVWGLFGGCSGAATSLGGVILLSG